MLGELALGRHSSEIVAPAGSALAELIRQGDPARTADVLLNFRESGKAEERALALVTPR